MPYISNEQLDSFHHLYRINLINSCSGYKSANLLGTKSTEGNENNSFNWKNCWASY